MEEWYKNAIIYGVDVKLFYDGNNDGIGDFVGLTQKLDYIKSLGANCIWLLPFYPSEGRDNGYDITDYYSVDPRYGSIEEFEKFVKTAKKKGIKVIVDLVVHHTSDRHPWFLESRKHAKSKYRNYYVWTKKIPKRKFPESVPAFPGVESNVWRFDPIAKMFFFHRFYGFQPDLNIANPDVQDEILSIINFWMDLGVAGFRIDAAGIIFQRKGKAGTEVKDADKYLEKLDKLIRSRNPEAILLGEADVTENKVDFFFGNGNRMSLILNFLLNRFLFLGLAKKSAEPINKELLRIPVPPKSGAWVNFLRNLDELNIDSLQPGEKREVFNQFGKEYWMKIYERGIRRRLAPMMDGNLSRLKLCYALLFSLPGVPLIVYGDEIGMGDYLDLPEREAVRIPMQWKNSVNAGFSKVAAIAVYRAALSVGPYRYELLNVENELKKKDSLLTHIKELIKVRKQLVEIGSGSFKLLPTDNDHVFSIAYTHNGKQAILLHNLSDKVQKVEIIKINSSKMKEILSDTNYPGKGPSFALDPYGFRWFRG